MTEKLSYDEVVEKYGDLKVTFSSYYKYLFTFVGKMGGGGRISVSVGGGGADDIYKTEIHNQPVMLKSLPFSSVMVNGENVYSDFGW